jgi:S-DNA-T family DNA segregation ATPase FtsK/SpoIIIE
MAGGGLGWWQRLSAERKIDVLGVFLALLGLLSILSLLSKEHGTLTNWWVTALRQTGGSGAFILPVGLLLLGLWLILRKIDRFPSPSGERMTGFILLYVNILTWIHLIGSNPILGGWDLAAEGKGGGYIGAIFERGLVNLLGQGGAIIVLAAWGIIALVMALDISVTELFAFFRQFGGGLVDRWARERELQQARRIRAEEIAAEQALMQEEDDSQAEEDHLPADFLPLPGRGGITAAPREGENRVRLRQRERAAAAQEGGQAKPAAGGRPSTVSTHATGAQTAAPAPAWKLPQVAEILDPPTLEVLKTNVEQERGRLIEETLASFGAPAHVVDIARGPTVTQFGVEPDFVETRSGRTRVRVGKIVSLADDLALALAAQRIRIQAPVPGRSYVGIEVPNSEVSRVMLREVIESEMYQKLRSPLRFAVGKDVSGKSVSYDLASMPHLLIAGTTGSGKSVCVNSILSCLLLHNSPTELRMILVDPKRVELTGYNGIPHLLSPVIVDAERVVGALQWVQREMDARYHRFSQVGVRNIIEHNKKHHPILPYLLVLIDELADLMMLAPDETERSLTRLAQLARATGIHLVLATQRPSVDVVTGLIKANFPARIAFAVASQIDSRVILDQPGAERLLGRGDMLFQAPDSPAPMRLQGVWVSDPEIQRLIEYWRVQEYNLRLSQQGLHPSQMNGTTAEPVNMDAPMSTPLQQAPLFDGEMGAKEGDPLLEEAARVVRQEGRASISMLQRKLRVGYTRAARLIDSLEDKGIVGPAQTTSQVRAVLDMGDQDE